jgi:hypothetical protein
MKIHRRACLGLLAATATLPVIAQPARKRTVALLFDSLISPFWVAAIERFRRDIQARGWSTLEAVSNMDDNRQYTQVQSMIQRKVDGIVLVHTDGEAVIPAIRAANAAGVPIVHFNRPPAQSWGRWNSNERVRVPPRSSSTRASSSRGRPCRPGAMRCGVTVLSKRKALRQRRRAQSLSQQLARQHPLRQRRQPKLSGRRPPE